MPSPALVVNLMETQGPSRDQPRSKTDNTSTLFSKGATLRWLRSGGEKRDQERMGFRVPGLALGERGVTESSSSSKICLDGEN